jgi:hypothetical protein
MITFIAAKETGVDVLTWGPDLKFPADKPVLVDTDDAKTGDARIAPTHPHFKVEEVKGKKAKAKPVEAEAGQPAEDDYPEEPANGDTTIPPDFRDMHHKKLIALARRMGGEGDALATRDGAIAFLEEQIAQNDGLMDRPDHA